ncbi:ClcB-like voltage-gated chloride channel protein [Herbaspirillum huttiense]|uniref:ClcB-like voltage-gated chloride channel protein n=1 Tax=Herbaspirillum huttiense TaxID=863372 RepID=UPI0039AF2BD1
MGMKDGGGRWSFLRLQGDHTMLLWAVVAGLAGALATAAFREAIDLLQRMIGSRPGDFVQMARHLPWPLRFALPAAGGVIAGLCLVIAQKRPSPKGGADYMDVIVVGNGAIPVWQSLWRSLSSLFSIASGGSIGREGPMVQLAALCASLIGRVVRFDTARLRVLVACGGAAGITSAYNAPIAGAFFICELVLGSMAMEWFGPILVACVVANIAMRKLGGYHPPYEMPAFPAIEGMEVVPFVLLGLLCGVLAPLFLRTITVSKRWVAGFTMPLPVKLGYGGLAVGFVSIWVPEVWGNGYEVVSALLHNPWTWQALLLVLAAKIVATMASVGSGAVGGVFTPTLFVGAVLGNLIGLGVHAMWPAAAAAPYAYAMVGMGAFLAAATNAPMMAILMIFEMTLSYQIVLPLMLSSVLAYFVARSTQQTVMYEVTERRQHDLRDRLRLAETRMADLLRPAETVVPLTAGLDEMMSMFTAHSVKYLYVTDEEGGFRGVVALRELTTYLHSGGEGRSMAADFLTPGFYVLTSDMSLTDALHLFREFKGERLPVINDKLMSRHLLGVVHKTALLDAYVRLGPAPAASR